MINLDIDQDISSNKSYNKCAEIGVHTYIINPPVVGSHSFFPLEIIPFLFLRRFILQNLVRIDPMFYLRPLEAEGIMCPFRRFKFCKSHAYIMSI